MAVEIITPGNVEKIDPWYTGTCYKCRCQIRAKKADGKYFTSQRDGDHLAVPCPTPGCQQTIFCYPADR